MNDNASKHLNDMLAKYTAMQNAPLVRPHPQAAQMPGLASQSTQVLDGLASIFGLFGDGSKKAAERILSVAGNVKFFKFCDYRVDTVAWRTIRDELEEMKVWLKEPTDLRHQYVEREAYLTHMLKAFGEGERFIVAKLSYDGGEA